MNANENALAHYANNFTEIFAILEALQNWADDHGGIDPDDVTWESVGDTTEVLTQLREIAQFIGVVPDEVAA